MFAYLFLCNLSKDYATSSTDTIYSAIVLCYVLFEKSKVSLYLVCFLAAMALHDGALLWDLFVIGLALTGDNSCPA